MYKYNNINYIAATYLRPKSICLDTLDTWISKCCEPSPALVLEIMLLPSEVTSSTGSVPCMVSFRALWKEACVHYIMT